MKQKITLKEKILEDNKKKVKQWQLRDGTIWLAKDCPRCSKEKILLYSPSMEYKE